MKGGVPEHVSTIVEDFYWIMRKHNKYWIVDSMFDSELSVDHVDSKILSFDLTWSQKRVAKGLLFLVGLESSYQPAERFAEGPYQSIKANLEPWTNKHTILDATYTVKEETTVISLYSFRCAAQKNGPMKPSKLLGVLNGAEAYLMSHFTFVIYDPQVPTVHADAIEWGWNLVGYAESLPSEPRADVACFCQVMIVHTVAVDQWWV